METTSHRHLACNDAEGFNATHQLKKKKDDDDDCVDRHLGFDFESGRERWNDLAKRREKAR
jgi:hypothetical protein